VAAKLQVSRPTPERGPAPSRGGSAGSNPVGRYLDRVPGSCRGRQRLPRWRPPLADPSTVEALTSRILGE
jgi:hypothetical protein